MVLVLSAQRWCIQGGIGRASELSDEVWGEVMGGGGRANHGTFLAQAFSAGLRARFQVKQHCLLKSWGLLVSVYVANEVPAALRLTDQVARYHETTSPTP